jgi:hypothetical protein
LRLRAVALALASAAGHLLYGCALSRLHSQPLIFFMAARYRACIRKPLIFFMAARYRACIRKPLIYFTL